MLSKRTLLALLSFGTLGCSGSTTCEDGAANFDISESLTADEWAGVQEFWGEADTEEYYCRYACGKVVSRIYGWELYSTERCVMDVPEPQTSGDTGDTGSGSEISAVVTCEGTMVEQMCD